MSGKSTVIVAVAAFILVGLGLFAYFSHEPFRKGTNEFVREHILGEGTKVDSVATSSLPHWIYLIADPTDIEDGEFAIPRVDTAFINGLLTWQFDNGGGCFWLTYIDNRSQDNEVKYLPVPSRKSVPALPIARSGETSFDFTERMTMYEKQKPVWVADSARTLEDFLKAKITFLQDCQVFLTRQVYVTGSPTHRRSDVIGSLNAGFRSLSVSSNIEGLSKYIIAFSDLVHNVKNSPSLGRIPDDVTIIAVNPMPGSSKKVTENVTEVEHPRRVFDILSASERAR